MHQNKISAISENLYRLLSLLPLLLIMLFYLAACGKKGDPTLKAYEKPAPPAALHAIHREEKIILQWAYPAGKENEIANFIILKSAGAEFKQLVHIEKNKQAYEDTAFVKDGNYRYKVIARSFTGVYSNDSNILGISPLVPPFPPSNLSFTIQGNSLLLTWEPAEKGLHYNVYKSAEKGSYGLTPVNNTPISGNSFSDSFVINKTVYYTVRSLLATEIRDEGASSEELVVDPAELVPAPLKNLKYHAAPDRVFLYWDEPAESWVTRFRIYRRTEDKDYLLIGETQIPSFADKEPALTKRDYRIHAVGPLKEGPGFELRGVLYVPE